MSKKEKLPAHIITENDIINDSTAMSMEHYDIESKGLLNLIKIVKPDKKHTSRSLPKKSSKKSSRSLPNKLSK